MNSGPTLQQGSTGDAITGLHKGLLKFGGNRC
jgi:hypothetical protein